MFKPLKCFIYIFFFSVGLLYMSTSSAELSLLVSNEKYDECMSDYDTEYNIRSLYLFEGTHWNDGSQVKVVIDQSSAFEEFVNNYIGITLEDYNEYIEGLIDDGTINDTNYMMVGDNLEKHVTICGSSGAIAIIETIDICEDCTKMQCIGVVDLGSPYVNPVLPDMGELFDAK